MNALVEGLKDLNLDYNDIKNVFITHEHVDHVLGLYPLLELMENDLPEIYAYGETAKILRNGDIEQIFPGNLGISPEMFGAKIVPLKINELTIENKILLSNFNFQILYTPGHSLGSICYYDESKKLLIPGDVVFTGGSFGRYDFPGGSITQLQNSIKIVNELDVVYLLPGHMDISKDGNRQIERSYRNIQMFGSYF